MLIATCLGSRLLWMTADQLPASAAELAMGWQLLPQPDKQRGTMNFSGKN